MMENLRNFGENIWTGTGNIFTVGQAAYIVSKWTPPNWLALGVCGGLVIGRIAQMGRHVQIIDALQEFRVACQEACQEACQSALAAQVASEASLQRLQTVLAANQAMNQSQLALQNNVLAANQAASLGHLALQNLAHTQSAELKLLLALCLISFNRQHVPLPPVAIPAQENFSIAVSIAVPIGGNNGGPVDLDLRLAFPLPVPHDAIPIVVNGTVVMRAGPPDEQYGHLHIQDEDDVNQIV